MWWSGLDSNQQPSLPRFFAAQLTFPIKLPPQIWWTIKDSNLEPTGYEPGALTIELMVHNNIASFLRSCHIAYPLVPAHIRLYEKGFLSIRLYSDVNSTLARDIILFARSYVLEPHVGLEPTTC